MNEAQPSMKGWAFDLWPLPPKIRRPLKIIAAKKIQVRVLLASAQDNVAAWHPLPHQSRFAPKIMAVPNNHIGAYITEAPEPVAAALLQFS